MRMSSSLKQDIQITTKLAKEKGFDLELTTRGGKTLYFEILYISTRKAKFVRSYIIAGYSEREIKQTLLGMDLILNFLADKK